MALTCEGCFQQLAVPYRGLKGHGKVFFLFLLPFGNDATADGCVASHGEVSNILRASVPVPHHQKPWCLIGISHIARSLPRQFSRNTLHPLLPSPSLSFPLLPSPFLLFPLLSSPFLSPSLAPSLTPSWRADKGQAARNLQFFEDAKSFLAFK